MTTLTREDTDVVAWRAQGVMREYDGDALAWAAERARVALVDGRPVVRDCRGTRRLRVERGLARSGRSGLWVPEHELIRLGIRPVREADAGHNLLLTAGITRLWSLFANQGATQAFDATHTRTAAGNGSTAPAIGDTDLSAVAGSANRWFNLIDALATITTNKIQWVSTFATGNGNFAWNEWGTDNGTAGAATVSAPLLNRATPAGGLGTKTSAAAWAFTTSITLA